MSESKIERATKIKARMEEYRLTSQWLLLRLAQECDIELDKSTLSQILSGTRSSGNVPAAVLAGAEQILDKYKSTYLA